MQNFNDVITLVKETKTVNDYGDMVATTTNRNVFCRVNSIGMSEFYQAKGVGLRPEIRFTISDYLDYEGEERLVYNEDDYTIIRTYRNGKLLEITCHKGLEA